VDKLKEGRMYWNSPDTFGVVQNVHNTINKVNELIENGGGSGGGSSTDTTLNFEMVKTVDYKTSMSHTDFGLKYGFNAKAAILVIDTDKKVLYDTANAIAAQWSLHYIAGIGSNTMAASSDISTTQEDVLGYTMIIYMLPTADLKVGLSSTVYEKTEPISGNIGYTPLYSSAGEFSVNKAFGAFTKPVFTGSNLIKSFYMQDVYISDTGTTEVDSALQKDGNSTVTLYCAY
jgi:hypothetical protein